MVTPEPKLDVQKSTIEANIIVDSQPLQSDVKVDEPLSSLQSDQAEAIEKTQSESSEDTYMPLYVEHQLRLNVDPMLKDLDEKKKLINTLQD